MAASVGSVDAHFTDGQHFRPGNAFFLKTLLKLFHHETGVRFAVVVGGFVDQESDRAAVLPEAVRDIGCGLLGLRHMEDAGIFLHAGVFGFLRGHQESADHAADHHRCAQKHDDAGIGLRVLVLDAPDHNDKSDRHHDINGQDRKFDVC